MEDKTQKNLYDDGNIPKVDLPHENTKSTNKKGSDNIEPLPESARPRKDGPGGE